MPRDSAKIEDTGKRIRARRKELGFTGLTVAQYVGVTRAAVSQWELGDSNITAENLLRLSQLLRIDPFELMGIDGAVVPGSRVNVDRLSAALEALEGFAARKKIQLSSRAKAKVLGYMCEEEDGNITDKELLRLIGLAS
jgi:transcriptional regulator with XRE-family HTH domain